MQRNIPPAVAVLVILAFVLVVFAIGLWYLKRPAPIRQGEASSLTPVIPGSQGQTQQQPSTPQQVTPTY